MRQVLILISIFFLCSFHLRASHAAGGYFEYKYLGDNNYEIFFYFLRDCDGIQPVIPTLHGKNDCGFSCQNYGSMTFISSNYVDYGCGNTCIGVSNYPGYELYKYSRVVNTPTLCDSWEFSVNIPERNLVDYNDNFGANLAIYCRINNSLGNYDSPTINGANVVIGCTDYSAEAQFTVQPFLPTSIICTPTPSLLPVGECSYNSIGYSNGLSFSNPFPSTGYNVNPDNGQVTFTPIAPGTTYFAILVRSYDGANLVGEILVEGMIIISNCLQSSMVNISPLNNNRLSDLINTYLCLNY